MNNDCLFESMQLTAALNEYLRAKYGTFKMLHIKLDVLYPWTYDHKEIDLPISSTKEDIAKAIISLTGHQPYDNYSCKEVDCQAVFEDGFTKSLSYQRDKAEKANDVAKLQELIALVNKKTEEVSNGKKNENV